MDKSNYFIRDTARFGAYPTQSEVEELENIGTRYFLDLTNGREQNTYEYFTNYNYENFPIKDGCVPDDIVKFSNLIIRYGEIIENLEPGEKLYIHCRGGHGRSGLVSACLLSHIYNISAENAMYITTRGHCSRKSLSEKWRTLSSPQSRKQRMFVLNYFKPQYLFTGYKQIKKELLPFAKGILDIYNSIDKTDCYWHQHLYLEMVTFLSDEEHRKDLINTGMRKLIFNYNIESKMLIAKYIQEIRIDFIKELINK